MEFLRYLALIQSNLVKRFSKEIAWGSDTLRLYEQVNWLNSSHNEF